MLNDNESVYTVIAVFEEVFKMFFDLLKRHNINEKVEEFRKTENAVLLDVRTEAEYSQGHIPHSINVDVDRIEDAVSVISDKNTPVFVYCHGGARSGYAVNALRKMGYSNAVNIGGISSYSGKLETGRGNL